MQGCIISDVLLWHSPILQYSVLNYKGKGEKRGLRKRHNLILVGEAALPCHHLNLSGFLRLTRQEKKVTHEKHL